MSAKGASASGWEAAGSRSGPGLSQARFSGAADAYH